jgi:hypothetical protein
VVHPVVLLRFRTDLAEGAIEAILKELRCFRQSIPGITGFQGRAYNASEGLAKGFTHGFTMSFADAAVVKVDKDTILTEDLSLLYYYRNRLAGYGLSLKGEGYDRKGFLA